jgi:hypothetical protein
MRHDHPHSPHLRFTLMYRKNKNLFRRSASKSPLAFDDTAHTPAMVKQKRLPQDSAHFDRLKNQIVLEIIITHPIH